LFSYLAIPDYIHKFWKTIISNKYVQTVKEKAIDAWKAVSFSLLCLTLQI